MTKEKKIFIAYAPSHPNDWNGFKRTLNKKLLGDDEVGEPAERTGKEGQGREFALGKSTIAVYDLYLWKVEGEKEKRKTTPWAGYMTADTEDEATAVKNKLVGLVKVSIDFQKLGKSERKKFLA